MYKQIYFNLILIFKKIIFAYGKYDTSLSWKVINK